MFFRVFLVNFTRKETLPLERRHYIVSDFPLSIFSFDIAEVQLFQLKSRSRNYKFMLWHSFSKGSESAGGSARMT